MGSDGANSGIAANDALGIILGGEPQSEKKTRTPQELREEIMAAKHPDLAGLHGGDGYSNAANYCAKLVLELFERHPELASVPMNGKYEYDRDSADWKAAWDARKIVVEGLDDAIKRVEPGFMQTTFDLGLSGFQWGWAVNAARYCMALPPTTNPALLTITLKDES